MKNILNIIVLTVFVIGTVSAGGPWPQPKGKGYFKLSEWWTVFSEHYTDTGLKDPNLTTGVFNTAIYAEYGLTNRLTTVINAPFLSRNYMNNLRSGTSNELIIEGESINTIGDIELGLKFGLTNPGAKIPISMTLTLGVPTGTTGGGSLGALQTGDGEFNQMLQIDAGIGFNLGGLSAYASTYVGFNNRTNGYSEEIRYGVEVGFGLINQRLWLNGRLTAVESFKNGDTAETVTSTSLFANNTEFTSIGVEANLYITKNIGISAGVAGAIRGEIIAAAPSYSVGIFYDMTK